MARRCCPRASSRSPTPATSISTWGPAGRHARRTWTAPCARDHRRLLRQPDVRPVFAQVGSSSGGAASTASRRRPARRHHHRDAEGPTAPTPPTPFKQLIRPMLRQIPDVRITTLGGFGAADVEIVLSSEDGAALDARPARTGEGDARLLDHLRRAPLAAAGRARTGGPAQARGGGAAGRHLARRWPACCASPPSATSTPTWPSSPRASAASRSACACPRTTAQRPDGDRPAAGADRQRQARRRWRSVADLDVPGRPGARSCAIGASARASVQADLQRRRASARPWRRSTTCR